MGDRVAIIGGSTTDWDHFPFPVSSELGGRPLSDFPFAIDLNTACKWFYRVRRWNVVVNFTITDYSFGVPSTNSYFRSWDFGLGVVGVDATYETTFLKYVADRESDLVAADTSGNSLIVGRANTQADFAGDPDFWFPFNVLNFESSDVDANFDYLQVGFRGGSPLFRSSGSFLPVCYFDLQTGEDYHARSGESSLGSVVGSLTIDGLTTDIFCNNFGSGSVYSVLDAVDCVVSPRTFWPYATKDGNPVYNTSTGVQINDPFS